MTRRAAPEGVSIEVDRVEGWYCLTRKTANCRRWGWHTVVPMGKSERLFGHPPTVKP